MLPRPKTGRARCWVVPHAHPGTSTYSSSPPETERERKRKQVYLIFLLDLRPAAAAWIFQSGACRGVWEFEFTSQTWPRRAWV